MTIDAETRAAQASYDALSPADRDAVDLEVYRSFMLMTVNPTSMWAIAASALEQGKTTLPEGLQLVSEAVESTIYSRRDQIVLSPEFAANLAAYRSQRENFIKNYPEVMAEAEAYAKQQGKEFQSRPLKAYESTSYLDALIGLDGPQVPRPASTAHR